MKSLNKMSKIVASLASVQVAFLFGSFAKGKERKTSDVDVALLLKRPLSAEKRLKIRLEMAGKLSDLTGREADVIILNTVGSILKYQVVRDGHVLFERKKGLAKKFKINAINEYFDYLPTFNFHYERSKERSKDHG